jgi:hypothetical protein
MSGCSLTCRLLMLAHAERESPVRRAREPGRDRPTGTATATPRRPWGWGGLEELRGRRPRPWQQPQPPGTMTPAGPPWLRRVRSTVGTPAGPPKTADQARGRPKRTKEPALGTLPRRRQRYPEGGNEQNAKPRRSSQVKRQAIEFRKFEADPTASIVAGPDADSEPTRRPGYLPVSASVRELTAVRHTAEACDRIISARMRQTEGAWPRDQGLRGKYESQRLRGRIIMEQEPKQDDAVSLLIAEYSNLRQEQFARGAAQFQLISLNFTAAAAIASVAVVRYGGGGQTSTSSALLLMILPVISFGLGIFYYELHSSILMVGHYIRDVLEPAAARLTEADIFKWEKYIRQYSRPTAFKHSQALSMPLSFCGIGIIALALSFPTIFLHAAPEISRFFWLMETGMMALLSWLWVFRRAS